MSRTSWKLTDRLQKQERVIGPAMGADFPLCVTELLAGLGYDFIWLDLEHGEMDLSTAIQHVRMARRCDVAAIIRVPSAGDARITPLLDAGVQAIVFAQTETVDQARQQVAVTKFPPLGSRSVTNRKGFTDYLQRDVGQILEEGNRNVITLPQIESVAGVERITELLAVEGIGGAMMGLSDLAVDMGLAGNSAHPDVVSAARTVCDACAGSGKWFAVYSRDEKALQEWKAAGAQILVATSIMSFISRAGGDILGRLKGEPS